MKKKYTVAEDGFVGYWHPADGHAGKAIIVFPGSGADYELTRKGSEFLRNAGWSCLLVAFAGWDGLPEDPVLAPVEYAEKAAMVLKEAGYEKVGAYGISAGAKYAITAASLLPDISLVIAASPFDYTTEDLLLLEAVIPANEKFYVWCYGEDGQFIDTSCPESERGLLEAALRLSGGLDKAIACAASQRTTPLLIGAPFGMQWAVTLETERKRSLLFIMGPVFYATPTEDQLRASLHPCRDTRENAAWAADLIRRLPDMPVMPHALFTRYVMMVHNTLTGQQLDVSVLFEAQSGGRAESVQAPETRDRTKVYLAERALLKMVRNGDINYQRALNTSNSLSAGVPVQGSDPLWQNRISIIVLLPLSAALPWRAV